MTTESEKRVAEILRKFTDVAGYEDPKVPWEPRDLDWDTTEMCWEDARDLYLAYVEMKERAERAEAVHTGAEEVREILQTPSGDLVSRIRSLKQAADHALWYKANWHCCMGLADQAYHLINDLRGHEGAEGLSASTYEAIEAWEKAWEFGEAQGTVNLDENLIRQHASRCWYAHHSADTFYGFLVSPAACSFCKSYFRDHVDQDDVEWLKEKDYAEP